MVAASEWGEASRFSAVITSSDADRIVVSMRGELDMAGGGLLWDCLRDAGDQQLHLDMAEITFIDSQGLNELLLLARRHRVVLRRPSEVVTKLLDLAGVRQAFDVAEGS